MEERVVSDIERCNRVAMLCHIAEAMIYIGTFIGEYLSGNREILYVLMVVLLAGGPTMAEVLCWMKNHESPAIKHLVAYGFAVLYTFVIFTTTNAALYVYVIPIVFVVSIYNDVAYMAKICIGIILENCICAIAGLTNGGFGFVNRGSSLSQIAVIIMVAVYSLLTVKTLQDNSNQKLKNIKKANEKTEALLAEVNLVTDAMKSGIDDVYDKVDKLSESSKLTKEAMREVSAGITETALTAQKQLEQTEEIQRRAEVVGSASGEINESMRETLLALQKGQQDIRALAGEVDSSVQKGVNVAKELEELDIYMEKMHSIVALIQGITSQTSMLALNASIEAARAGEAGRGFSVVATEISGMAVQTKDATVQITQLIQNVTNAINNVVAVIREMIEGINQEKQFSEDTVRSFEKIQKNADIIQDNVKKLTDGMKLLNVANGEIAASIETISAVSEEVSAHATQTLSAEEQNMLYLEGINHRMQDLLKVGQV